MFLRLLDLESVAYLKLVSNYFSLCDDFGIQGITKQKHSQKIAASVKN